MGGLYKDFERRVRAALASGRHDTRDSQAGSPNLDGVAGATPKRGRLVAGDGTRFAGLEPDSLAVRDARLLLGIGGGPVGTIPTSATTIGTSYAAASWTICDGDQADAYWSSDSEITIRRSGWYELRAVLACTTGAAGTLYAKWQRTGTDLVEHFHSNQVGFNVQVEAWEPWVFCAAGDVLRVMVRYDSTASSTWRPSRVSVRCMRWRDEMEILKVLGSSAAWESDLDELWLTLDANAADHSSTTPATHQTITGLPAGVHWEWEWILKYQAGATTTGVRVAPNFTGTPTGWQARKLFATTATTTATAAATSASATNAHMAEMEASRTNGGEIGISSASVDAADSDLTVEARGSFYSSTTGDLQLKLGAEVAAAVRARAGTVLKLRRLSP